MEQRAQGMGIAEKGNGKPEEGDKVRR